MGKSHDLTSSTTLHSVRSRIIIDFFANFTRLPSECVWKEGDIPEICAIFMATLTFDALPNSIELEISPKKESVT